MHLSAISSNFLYIIIHDTLVMPINLYLSVIIYLMFLLKTEKSTGLTREEISAHLDAFYSMLLEPNANDF